MYGKLLADINERMRVLGIPGLSIRIAEQKKNIFSYDAGFSSLSTMEPLTDTHLFRIGCLTKPFIAQAVLMLAEQKKIALHAGITQYLPELNVNRQLLAITVSHLLSHTSGLARGPYLAEATPETDWTTEITRASVYFEPGRQFKYSNWGYFLLGKMIERISQDSLANVLSTAIFKPLKMEQGTAFNLTPKTKRNLATGHWREWYFGSPMFNEIPIQCPLIPISRAASGLISNADNLMHWLHYLNTDISQALKDELLTVRHKITDRINGCYGLLNETINNQSFYYCTGSNSGYSGFIFLIPEKKRFGVALCNVGHFSNELRDCLNRVCQTMFTENTPPDFGRCERKGSLKVWKRKSELLFQFQKNGLPEVICDRQCYSLYPYSENTYYILNSGKQPSILRVIGKEGGNSQITWGDQIFYEDLRKLRKTPSQHDEWKIYTGRYQHACFGKVDIIYREDQLFLSYGVAFETELIPVSGTEFKQKTGAFCLENIEFEVDDKTSSVTSFLGNHGMRFRRISSSANSNHIMGISNKSVSTPENSALMESDQQSNRSSPRISASE